MNSVEQLRVRHGLLVEKKFLEGLTKRESNELAQINRLLDDSEEKYYAPIKKTLATVIATFSGQKNRLMITARSVAFDLAQDILNIEGKTE